MAWEKKFGDIVGSGPYPYLPASFIKDDDSNIYRMLLGIMQAWDTEINLQNIRDEEREVINAVGKYLEC